MRFDCNELVRGASGEGYSSEYEGFLAFFSLLAHAEQEYVCENVPVCWAPFVRYLGHKVDSVWNVKGWDAEWLDWNTCYSKAVDKRHTVEMASTARPELVHALYLADTAWPCRLTTVPTLPEFLVTSNGSFFRKEVRHYQNHLRNFVPAHRRCIITSCAAEKPYPSQLHQEILQRIPENTGWHVIVSTTVLGLAPQELWPIMPKYDAGIPYPQRVVDTVAEYFEKHRYRHIVVYADFLADAIFKGLELVTNPPDTCYLMGHFPRDTYENLMLFEHLQRLERTLNAINQEHPPESD